MKRKRMVFALLLLLLAASLAAGSAAVAQTSVHYNLTWHVFAGGAPASSAHYRVNASVGQQIASPPQSASARYAVSGGFWFPGIAWQPTYLPLVLRSAP